MIDNLGLDPASSQGNFDNEPVGLFSDQVLFQLSEPLSHLTIASVTNTFAVGHGLHRWFYCQRLELWPRRPVPDRG